MDPGGSELDSSLPQPENPCLIVEDSQPDSVALEDDPETSYRTLLARRLSNLQPTSRSPVLELISSPPGSINSQTDSQPESFQSISLVKPVTNSISTVQEESQVINICPPPNKRRGEAEDPCVDSGADSTTHCSQHEEGTSQFGFLELSQSQDQYSSKVMNNQQETIPPQESEKCTKTAEQNISSRTSGSPNNNSVRSEVSSSSSSDSGTHPVRMISVQVLLHSQGLKDSGEPEQQDSEIMSSQEDLFEADKSGVGVDSTMSEPEQQVPPTSTPSHTLRLLHLSGQETLVKESLSQSSVDYVAATPDKFSHTPLIVPSSPTGPENGHDADEPMDTSLPPDDLAGTKASQTDVASKPQPSASTPVSQSCPGFGLERTLSIPSQPEFSHDVFVPTQSQDSAKSSDKKSASLLKDTSSECLESTSFALPLELSVHTENSGQAQQTSEKVDDDSQATQIEEFEESSCVDVCHSVSSNQEQKVQRNNDVTNNPVLSSTVTESPTRQIDCDKIEVSSVTHKTEVHTEPETSSRVSSVKVKETTSNSADTVSCSQPKLNSSDGNVSGCVQETPSDITPCSLPLQSMSSSEDVVRCSVDVKGGGLTNSQSQHCAVVINSLADNSMMDKQQQDEANDDEDEDVIMLEEEKGDEASGMALALSQSQMLSPEPMEEDSVDQGLDSVIVVTDSEKDSQVVKTDVVPQTNSHQPAIGTMPVSTNGHQTEEKEVNVTPARLSQTEKVSPVLDGLKDKSLSDSSGDISFHFTLPKEGELIGPAAAGTPPLIKQLKQTLRHSTPIDMVAGSPDAAMAASDIMPAEAQEDLMDRGDGKLSLRMKLVTPVEEGSSESFSLQKPSLTEENGSVIKTTTVSKAVTSSPSVFSRVRQVHRQQKGKDESQHDGNSTLVRGELFASPLISSQMSSLGCNSLPNSQSETSQQEVLRTPQKKPSNNPHTAQQSEERQGATKVSEPTIPNNTDAQKKGVSQHAIDSTVTFSLSNKLHQRTVSQQTSFDAPGLHSPTGRSEPTSPSFRRTTGPSHCRHVRTIQEVRTTITRIITDVYYEDGKEVERKVTEESEEPVVHCQVLDGDISPCRTGSSSVTSGDLGDVSSLSSKASSLQHSSGGTSSSTGFTRPQFIVPSSRGARSFSPRKGGGHQQRGQRGHRAGAFIMKDGAYGTMGSQVYIPLSPRGRVRRGRPPSRSSPARGRGSGLLQRQGAQENQPSSSEDEPYACPLPILPVSPTDVELPSHSDSLRSSPEEASLAGSSFVGLQVVAKWSSNGYFYSGRIISDAGEGRYRLRFDDGYECEVIGKDILLCDPIPLETEVTALLEDEYFSIGVVKGHKTEGVELFYSVERDGQRQWYNRTSIILSLEQGNKLREQHSLGPYEPSTPLAKASDISLDNLVEGKRRRRVTSEGQNTTPNRSSSSSSRTPGTSKRKLRTGSEDNQTPAKRGRRGPGARAVQRVGECNTSGSGTDLPGQSTDVSVTHGPLPQNASLFMGFVFMLTASSETDRLSNKSPNSDEEDIVPSGPYNKTYTESQLQAGGGFILPDFNEEQCNAAYQSLLISDQHCRTRRYLLCLASGVPCVSHMWVRDCCKENKLLNYRNYLLPAGVGPDDGIVEWHPRCSPFKTLRVLLVFEKPVELWAQLITMGGGASVRQFPGDKDNLDIASGKYDVVVTDHACPPLVEQNLTSQEIPLVSPEWLIQSIISGEQLGFHSRPQYRHDFTS